MCVVEMVDFDDGHTHVNEAEFQDHQEKQAELIELMVGLYFVQHKQNKAPLMVLF